MPVIVGTMRFDFILSGGMDSNPRYQKMVGFEPTIWRVHLAYERQFHRLVRRTGFGLTGASVRDCPDTGCSSSDDLLEVFSDGI